MAINLTLGAARELIDASQATALRNAGVLVQDARRERPRYFDGRFLAARDLIRDQQYFMTREADLGRAAGSGVAAGLEVEAGGGAQSLRVSAGHGITPAGELVLLPGPVDLDLADIPAAEQLSTRFGLGRIPVPPLRTRTGLFVLALRPVEFTANPIGAYPTSITGPRSVEDGDVVEATALVLVPWQDDGAADALDARRSRAARTIFAGDGRAGVSSNVLPIAMLALQSNALAWIDAAMVRRELGAERGDLPGLGFAPRALRLAHVLQHQSHLAGVVAQLGGRSFPAATQFQALPPAGPLPPGVIDTRDFTQRYFPAEVDVDFSIIPDDELPMLVEEALALPPIDFLASEATLDRTAVMLLAPVPRNEWRAVIARLESRVRTLRPAAPNLVAQRKPLEILQRLRVPLPLPLPDVSNPSDAEWARLARLPNLWFVRRRNLAYRDDLAGAPVAVSGRSEVVVERDLRARLGALGLDDSFERVLSRSTPQARPGIINLLASPRIADSPSLTAATLGSLVARTGAAADDDAGGATDDTTTEPAPTLDRAAVLGVTAELTRAGVGDGLARLERNANAPVDRNALVSLASGDGWRALDDRARTASDARVGPLVNRLSPTPAVPRSPAPPMPDAAPRAARDDDAAPGQPSQAGRSASPARSAKLAAGARKAAARKTAAKKGPAKKAGK